MSKKSDPKEPALVRGEDKALTSHSASLVKRGLDALVSEQPRIVHFPSDRSMGTLFLTDLAGTWLKDEDAKEARGDIIVPSRKRLALCLHDWTSAVFDLSPLSSLRPNDLHEISYIGSEVSDEDLVHIKHLRCLEKLKLLYSNQISDAGLSHLRELAALRALWLGTLHITDDGLVHLRDLTELESLILRCNSMSSAAFVHIVEWKKLRYLRLEDCIQMKGGGLNSICRLPFLDSLIVSRAELFGADIKDIQGLTNLKRLGLEGTRITDGGLKFLCGLTNLQYLNLASCQITDSGLVHLQNLRHLGSLNLSHTNVSGAGINSLQEALPECRISTRKTAAWPADVPAINEV